MFTNCFTNTKLPPQQQRCLQHQHPLTRLEGPPKPFHHPLHQTHTGTLRMGTQTPLYCL